MFRAARGDRPLALLLAGLLLLASFGSALAQNPHHACHAPATASASDCSPSWVPTFGSLPGVDGAIYELFVYDDGQGAGPALYVGGYFESAGAVPGTANLARWDGTDWSSVGGGLDAGMRAFAVFDDGQGGGPALYVGGSFAHAGGVAANGIAKWDGTSWSALGEGLTNGALLPFVYSLAVFDDGGGPALYVGGEFFYAGGQIVRNIARWDGLDWSGLGAGMNGGAGGEPQTVDALAVIDDGSGLQLYAGGNFTMVDSVPKNHIARWNGSQWSGVAGGVSGEVHCLSVLDLGSGPVLYVGGEFVQAGGGAVNRITAWDGTSWRNLGGGVGNGPSGPLPWVDTIAAYDDGNGPKLYAAGSFTEAGGATSNHIARFNGVQWTALDGGVAETGFLYLTALAVFDDGSGAGPRLHVGGGFGMAGSAAAHNLATWDGSDWAPGGVGPSSGLSDRVTAAVVFDDGLGGGPALVVGGDFTEIGTLSASRVARWDGTSWSALGAGLGDTVWALAVFDDGLGGGPALYAGGYFTFTGSPENEVRHVARWTGSDWVAVGGGMNSQVVALQVFDDGRGGGPALYAGGDFSSAGGAPGTQYIARWDGLAWHTLSGSGVSDGYFTFQGIEFLWVDTLEVFDDGSGGGAALYVGGVFGKAGGVPASRIAKWDGQAWSPLGSGAPAGSLTSIDDLEVFDDGTGFGPALYATGYFSSIGGVPAEQIARWNGSVWSAMGSGLLSSSDRMLAVHDDGGGSGPALYVGGDFSSVDGVPAQSVARWDGATWSALGDGIDGAVYELIGFDAGGGQGAELIVGGDFVDAASTGDSFLARWGGCPVEPSPWTFVGYALSGVDGPPLLAGTGSLLAGAPGTLALTHAAPSALSMLFVSLTGVSAPFKCGTLVPVPVNLQVLLFTNGAGSLPLGWAHWPGGLSGLSLYFQYAVQDPAAVCGVALSNALRADVP